MACGVIGNTQGFGPCISGSSPDRLVQFRLKRFLKTRPSSSMEEHLPSQMGPY